MTTEPGVAEAELSMLLKTRYQARPFCANRLCGNGGIVYAAENKTFLGAGGGGASDAYAYATDGAKGGGIIVVFAEEVIGPGVLRSNGGIAESICVGSGDAGCGGAGGTVILYYSTRSTTISTSVSGGIRCVGCASGAGGSSGNGVMLTSATE